LGKLLDIADRLMGHVEVLQGENPGGASSGVAIEQLRAEARGPLGFKSKYTEWMLERLVKLGLDAIVKWLPESVAQDICSRYPWPVLQTILARIDPKRYNISVEIASGKGINQLMDAERADRLYAAGGPGRLIGRRTAQEMNDVPDPAGEEREIIEEDQAAQAMLSPAAVPTGGGQGVGTGEPA